MDKNEFKRMNENLKKKYPELYNRGKGDDNRSHRQNTKYINDEDNLSDKINDIRDSNESLNGIEVIIKDNKDTLNKNKGFSLFGSIKEKINEGREKAKKKLNLSKDSETYENNIQSLDNEKGISDFNNGIKDEVNISNLLKERDDYKDIDNVNNRYRDKETLRDNEIIKEDKDVKLKSPFRKLSENNKDYINYENPRNIYERKDLENISKGNDKEDNLLYKDLDIQQKLNIKRKRKLTNKEKNIARLIFGVIIAILLLAFLPMFRVNSYEIVGIEHANRNKIEVLSNNLLGKHVFFLNTKDLKGLNSEDPYISDINVVKKYNGKAIINVSEIKRDFLLTTEVGGFYLSRGGKVLEITETTDGLVPILVDDTNPMNPGNTMYMDGDKKSFLKEYCDILDLNVSTIKFNEVNIVDINNIELMYNNWKILIGSRDNLKVKLNNAVNILKTVDENEAGEVDLRFNAPPVIRKY